MEGVALLNFVSSDPLGKVVLPIATLDSAGLEILVPKGRTFPSGDTAIVPLTLSYGCLPVTLGCLY